MNYHSALKKPLDIEHEETFFCKNGNIVIKHDLSNRLPGEFDLCDVFYSEPAWKHGYEKFLERAGAKTNSYEQYLHDISKNIHKKPFWLTTGRHALKMLPDPHRKMTVKIHNYESFLLGWNDENEYSGFKTNFDFIKLLSVKYDRVGDICCGYGNTGKIFINNGKKFVMSDINGKCVYYVKENLML